MLEAKAGKAGAETRVWRLHGSERLVPVRVQPQPAAQAQGSWKLRLKRQAATVRWQVTSLSALLGSHPVNSVTPLGGGGPGEVRARPGDGAGSTRAKGPRPSASAGRVGPRGWVSWKAGWQTRRSGACGDEHWQSAV